MSFAEYLDSVANTEDEARLLELLGMAKEGMEQAGRVIFVGKTMKALVALAGSDSIEEFKQTEHFNELARWDVKINLDKNSMSIRPGPEMRKKILLLTGAIAVIIFLMILRKKRKS